MVINENAEIAGDVFAVGGQIDILGSIKGQFKSYADILTINNSVTGAVSLNVAQNLSIGSKAVFGDNAKYKAPQEAEVASGATLGGLQFEKMTGSESRANGKAGFVTGLLTIGFVLKLLALIITAIVINHFFGRTTKELSNSLYNHFGKSFLIGLSIFIVVPIVSIFLMISMLGFYLALIMLTIWLLLLLLGSLLSTLFVGASILKALGKKSELSIDWQAIVIGVVVVGILSLVPILGMLFVFVLIVSGMGILARHLY